MKFEADIAGIFVPTLLLWVLVTYAICALLRPLAEKAGLYRLVWHRALFDLALYVCVLGGVVYLCSEWLS